MIPSNQMPKYIEPETKKIYLVIAWSFLVAIISGILYKAYDDIAFRYILIILIVIFLILNIYDRKKDANLIKERQDWDIGKFAKEFDLKSVDTWVIRAIYEAIYDIVGSPIKADDKLEEDLGIYLDDLEFDDILVEVEQRTGRKLTDKIIESYNFENLLTVRDLINFFNKIPVKCK